VQGVLAGFATIGIVIGLGFLLAQLRILDASAQGVLTRVAFYVASPALMITVLGGTDIHRLFSANLIASLGSVAVVAAIAVLLTRLLWKREAGDTVIAAFSAAYVNAANLGLPIAAYALGDAALVAPMLLAQLVILQPTGLAVLDAITYVPAPGTSTRRLLLIRLSQPFRNPLAVGSLIGLVLALTGIKLPVIINAPLTLVGGIAVPSMLLAYGISLRLGPRPGAGEPRIQIATLATLKLLVQPILAYLIGAYAVGLSGHDLLAVTVIAALPTAQNIFTFALRYDRGALLARDMIFVTTLLSVPVILIITWLLA
jgi:malonate transporter and related proteins